MVVPDISQIWPQSPSENSPMVLAISSSQMCAEGMGCERMWVIYIYFGEQGLPGDVQECLVTEDALTISACSLFQNGTAWMVEAYWRRRVQHSCWWNLKAWSHSPGRRWTSWGIPEGHEWPWTGITYHRGFADAQRKIVEAVGELLHTGQAEALSRNFVKL